MMLVQGRTKLVCWSSLLPFWALCIGRLLRVILGRGGVRTLGASLV